VLLKGVLLEGVLLDGVLLEVVLLLPNVKVRLVQQQVAVTAVLRGGI
jgi:hypothetical protein